MKRTCILLCIIALIAIAPVATAQNAAGYKWSSLPFGGGGFVTGFIASDQEQNVIYARTDVGGAYRWNEAIKGWTPITDFLGEDNVGFMGVESFAIDPSKPSRLYMYCGTKYLNSGKSVIMRSDDYGDTWTFKADVTKLFPANGNGSGRESGEELAIDPNDENIMLCGSRGSGLWRSMSGGSHWNRVGSDVFTDGPRLSFVQYIPSSGQKGEATPVVIVGKSILNSTNLFISNDGGTTWSGVENARTDLMPHRCTLDGNTLYITYTDRIGPTGGAGAIMKYDLNTGVWTDISPAKCSFGQLSLAHGKSGYLMTTSLGQYGPIYWSDKGTSWGDQIYLSRDGGKSWVNLMTSRMAVYNEPEVTWLKDAGKLHWCGSSIIDPFNDNRAFFISGNGIFGTESLWSYKPVFRAMVRGVEETVPLRICSVAGAPLATCLGDYSGGLYTDVTSYPAKYTAGGGSNTDVAIAPNNIQMMVRTCAKAYSSTDGGTTWAEMNVAGNSFSYFNNCAISSDGHIMVVTPKDSKPYYSIDGGVNWTMIDSALKNAIFHGDGNTEGIFYSFMNSKLYVYNINFHTGEISSSSIAETGTNLDVPYTVPGQSGEMWVPQGYNGINHIQHADKGADAITTTNIPVQRCLAVGFGKSATLGGYPTIFMWGRPKVTDAIGIYRSTDQGASWIRVNDDQHQFGGLGNARQVSGDMNVFGRVYLATIGRGVIYGEPVASADGISTASQSLSSSFVTISNHTVTITPDQGACTYSVYTPSGMLIQQGSVTRATNISDALAKGMYLLKISSKGSAKTYKFII
jgi:xyloglucan-specific exo-beta-1,4-glucanase